MFIDLFIDWGNLCRLTSVMLLIVLGKPYKLPVSSRTSSLDLVTDVNLSWFCNILDTSIMIYKDCTSDHKNIVFVGYKEGYLCLRTNIQLDKITCVVNFCWSEHSTLSGSICSTLEITYYIQCMILPESGFIAFWTLSISWSGQYSCANSMNITIQIFCVIGYQKDHRIRTFCVIEH